MAKFPLAFFIPILIASFSLPIISTSKYIKISNAQIMSGDQLNIQSEPIIYPTEPTAPKTEISKRTLTSSDIFIGKNFKIKYGHLGKDESLSFSLSSDLIDFGILSPNNPVLRTNLLTAYTNSVGYSVFASENQELKSSDNFSIPDTTCDNGSCTQTTPALWKESTVYGFGYRCDNLVGSDCTDFGEAQFFKQFPDISKREGLEKIMRGFPEKRKKEAKITYKLNISNAQRITKYINTLTYIAVPNF